MYFLVHIRILEEVMKKYIDGTFKIQNVTKNVKSQQQSLFSDVSLQ